MIGILAVLPLYYGFWRLGRKVSLSPIEILTAFDAPLTREADGNADVRTLLRQIGNQPVAYGEAVSTNEKTGVENLTGRRRLVAMNAASVIQPRQGSLY